MEVPHKTTLSSIKLTQFLPDSIQVYVVFRLVQILDVNEKAQTIKTLVWLTYVSYVLCEGNWGFAKFFSSRQM